MEPLIIVGSGGHARVVLDAAIASGRYHPLGFVDDFRPAGQVIDDLPVVGSTMSLLDIRAEHPEMQVVVAIGDNFTRFRAVQNVEKLMPLVRWATVIDPSATVSRRAEIGEGSMIAAGAVLNPSVRLGKHVILNNCAALAHDNTFDDFSSVGPGVRTGGNVTVGSYSHIGIGATISHNVVIGDHVVVGAGAVVVGNFEDHVIVSGVPGRVMRTRQIGERYL
jgi:sugar O-acyltransferase (sialic acid O-acetyltransferase NeuD family)